MNGEIKLNPAQINQLKSTDLEKNWVDVHKEKSGDIKLDIWAKNWFKDGICRIISFISFGKLLNREAAIVRIATAVISSQPELFPDQSQQEMKDRNIQKLSPREQLRFALDKIEVDQLSAGIMYSKGEDLQKVLATYTKYLEEDRLKAEEFIKGTDVEGNTFLHHHAKMKGNIQKDGVLGLLDTLGEDNFKSLLSTRNKKQESPVSLALERGQMGLISVIYPISGESILSVKVDGRVLVPAYVNLVDIQGLILKLSDPLRRDELLEECPGENDFDKVNHIMDALFRMVLYGYGDAIRDGIKLAAGNVPLLPQELQRLSSLGEDQCKEIFENLRGECESITTPDGVHQKMVEWQYEPLKREPETIIPLPDALRENGDDPLTHLVFKALQTKDEAERNAYYNHVVALINPFAASDQQIDFSSQASLQVLHNLVNVVVNNRAVILEDAKSLIKMLILKNPDFLTAKNESGDTISSALSKKMFNSPRTQDLLRHIIDIQKSLAKTLFENRVKRSLKYYLDDKERDLS